MTAARGAFTTSSSHALKKGSSFLRNKSPLVSASFHSRLYIFKCKCGEEFTYILEKYRLGVNRIYYPKCFKQPISKAESELEEWLRDAGIENIKRNKRIWENECSFEADIFLPDYNLAIEYDGLYWHSNLHRSDDYHVKKHEFFKSKGIDCIEIFENEWKNKKEIVQNIILNRLEKIENKIYARECQIVSVSTKESEKFLETNHLQGYCKAKLTIGLSYKSELVMLMSFSKPRYNKNYDWENIRTCTKTGISVVGGFSRLLKFFREKYNGSIISYVDKRFFNGKGYLENGFEFLRESEPNYFYFRPGENILHSRYEFQKHKLKEKLEFFDESLTEKENMTDNGFLWIYDCGNFVFQIS